MNGLDSIEEPAAPSGSERSAARSFADQGRESTHRSRTGSTPFLSHDESFDEVVARLYSAALAAGDTTRAATLAALADDMSAIAAQDPFPSSWKPERSEVGLYYGVKRRGDDEIGIVVCERSLRVPLGSVALRAARVRPMRATDFEYTGSVEPRCQRCGRRPLDGRG
jgi:hypothetical protein